MTDKELLRELHRDNKAINRNLQRLINIGMLGIFAWIGTEAKKNEDEEGKTIAKAGVLLIGLSQVILLIDQIADARKAVVEEELKD